MIIYKASKRKFLHHALRDDIEDVVGRHYRSATGHGASPAEVRAWKHSLLEMAKVLGDEESYHPRRPAEQDPWLNLNCGQQKRRWLEEPVTITS